MSSSRVADARQSFFADRSVCVTGAAGSVGRELIRQLLDLPVGALRALDRDENGLHDLTQAFGQDPRLQPRYCDITRPGQVDSCLRGMEFVFHAAALKHVPNCETAPAAAVDVNIHGLTNVIDAALRHRADRVIFTSSDKAANATNVMGATKLIGEKLALAAHMSNGHTIIACTRFGNIAGSRGSVIPLFCDQIRDGGPITLTSPDITRFFMSLEDAGRLVIKSMMSARNGETFVTRMKSMRIQSLAYVLRNLMAPAYGRIPAGIEIRVCGLRPGEKVSEELVTAEELRRCVWTPEYIVVLPTSHDPASVTASDYPLLGDIGAETTPRDSSRHPLLDDDAITAFLQDAGLLPEPVRARLMLRRKIADMAAQVPPRRARTLLATDAARDSDNDPVLPPAPLTEI